MSKIDNINNVIQFYLAELIVNEVETPNYLITISSVSCSPDLHVAKVFISVLPESHYGTALKSLRSKSTHLSRLLKVKSGLNKIPKLIWSIDEGVIAFEKISKVFKEIEDEE